MKVTKPAQKIPEISDGGTGVCFATGPGLTDSVVSYIYDRVEKYDLSLFGCNDAYQICPHLDLLYACDGNWWKHHYDKVKKIPYESKHGYWTQELSFVKTHPDVNLIKGSHKPGLSKDPGHIFYGSNSGYQLLNIAYLAGCRRIILAGYNLNVVDGRRHFFGDHPQGLNRSANYQNFVSRYKTIKPASYGLEIIQTTPNTKLTCFTNQSLSEALP